MTNMASINELKVTQTRTLISVLIEARELLARPDSEFSGSHWPNAVTAINAIDSVIYPLRHRHAIFLPSIELIFSSSGAEKVGVNSGWSKEFIELKARFEIAFSSFKANPWKQGH